jgi:hypothetical protein
MEKIHHQSVTDGNLFSELMEQIQTKAQFKFLRVGQLFSSLANSKTSTPFFIVFNGSKGSSKTYFAVRYLQEFCMQHSLVHYSTERIVKINEYLLRAAPNKQKFIDDAFELAKGNIIIISDLHKGNQHATLVADKINAIKDDEQFKQTVVVLSGTYKNNRSLIVPNRWQILFRHRLDFNTPQANQLTDTFANYLYEQSEMILTHDAKMAIRWYFKYRIQLDKEFGYADEMFQLRKQIEWQCSNGLLVDKTDVHDLHCYKQLVAHLKQL